jgi:hypothetical protein
VRIGHDVDATQLFVAVDFGSMTYTLGDSSTGINDPDSRPYSYPKAGRGRRDILQEPLGFLARVEPSRGETLVPRKPLPASLQVAYVMKFTGFTITDVRCLNGCGVL